MRLIVACIVVLWSLVRPAAAYTAEEMWAEFDASALTYQEKRFLQTALAFAGTYQALLDGAWGAGSQTALERWVQLNEMDVPVQNWQAVLLTFENAARFRAEGWEQRYFGPLDLSFLIPAGRLREETHTDHFLNFADSGSSLRYSLALGDLPQAVRLHSYVLSNAAAPGATYTLRRDAVLVTSVAQADGSTLYVRSDLRGGGWSSVVLSVAQADQNILNAVSGSIAKGQRPDFDLPPSGKLLQGLATMDRMLDDAAQPRAADDGVDQVRRGMAKAPAPPAPQTAAAMPSTPEAAPPVPDAMATGTAFMVSQAGHLITNAHVVEGCSYLRIDGKTVDLIAQDDTLDLALLRGQPAQPGDIARFAATPAPLNADVTVAGYPLSGLLSGLNVTRGSVTSLRGLAGDATTMQLSAPVQPGNSGGPAVDAAGNVVGVVVSKLDAKRLADATGDIPQNVNFAIRAEIARLFLFQNGVEPTLADAGDTPIGPTEIAARLDRMTRLVECFAPP